MTANGTAISDPLIQDEFLAALESEQQQLEDDISDYKLYPVISLSFVYNF